MNSGRIMNYRSAFMFRPEFMWATRAPGFRDKKMGIPVRSRASKDEDEGRFGSGYAGLRNVRASGDRVFGPVP
jgi:hypothetical protein